MKIIFVKAPARTVKHTIFHVQKHTRLPSPKEILINNDFFAINYWSITKDVLLVVCRGN
jgi:hypothetical protein